MEGVGARLGRSSTRYGPTTVFTGPVRKWKKKWVPIAPSNSNHHNAATNAAATAANRTVNGSNPSSHLLLYQWTPITPSQNKDNGNTVNSNGNEDSKNSNKDDAIAAEEPPKRKFKYIPIIVLEEQKNDSSEQAEDEAKPSEIDTMEATSKSDEYNDKPDINDVPIDEDQIKLHRRADECSPPEPPPQPPPATPQNHRHLPAAAPATTGSTPKPPPPPCLRPNHHRQHSKTTATSLPPPKPPRHHPKTTATSLPPPTPPRYHPRNHRHHLLLLLRRLPHPKTTSENHLLLLLHFTEFGGLHFRRPPPPRNQNPIPQFHCTDPEFQWKKGEEETAPEEEEETKFCYLPCRYEACGAEEGEETERLVSSSKRRQRGASREAAGDGEIPARLPPKNS